MGLADRPGQVVVRPRSIQRGPKYVHFGLVLYVCTLDRPGLGAGPSTVLTREGRPLHCPCIIVRTVRPGSADRSCNTPGVTVTKT
jgi:hypothetical protein